VTVIKPCAPAATGCCGSDPLCFPTSIEGYHVISILAMKAQSATSQVAILAHKIDQIICKLDRLTVEENKPVEKLIT
jgi:hypothetical protein